jgi:uncharacterized protein (DUF169 family)
MQQRTPPEQLDLAGMVTDLINLLRLKTTVIGMKMFATVEEMTAIPKIRRPTATHTTDQIVSMASRLGWTVGITADDLVGAQCRAVIGLAPQDEKWLAGESYVGVWHGTAEDARKRQEALDVVAFGQYKALAVSPLASGRLNPPDICLVYATPGQMIILINGLQYTGYKKFEWGVVGETACADSWGRALKTGEPSLSLPCFAERRYGGVPDEEMLRAALSDRALRHPERRARRHGRVLRQEIEADASPASHLPQGIQTWLRRSSTSLSMAQPVSPAGSSLNI